LNLLRSRQLDFGLDAFESLLHAIDTVDNWLSPVDGLVLRRQPARQLALARGFRLIARRSQGGAEDEVSVGVGAIAAYGLP
jgi:hypothetical protein